MNTMRQGTELNVPVKREGISILYCRSGHAVFCINDNSYPVGSGQGAIILKGSYHSIADRTEDFAFTELMLPSGKIGEYLQANDIVADLAVLAKYPVFTLADGDIADFEHLVGLCESLTNRQGKYHEKCIINIYLSLVYFVCEAARKDGVVATREIVSGTERQYWYFLNFLDLLAQYCREERNVKFYADKLCITPKYLSTVIKECSGKTATAWISEFVVAEAKQHLKFSSKSIQEISYMLNFPTQSFFGKYFKRSTGMSPVRYKTEASFAY